MREAGSVSAPRRKPGAYRAWRVLLVAAGGLSWAGCFTREPVLVLPWVALAPLVALAAAPRGGRWGWLHGTLHWGVAVGWVVPTLVTFGDLPRPLAVGLLGLLAAYLGAYHAVFVYLGRWIWRAGGLWSLLGLPALWVVLEWLRGLLFTGFPWNLAAYAWIDVPGALVLTAWIGSWGVSFLVLLANVGIARAIVGRSWESAVIGVLVPLAILPMAGRWSRAASPPVATGSLAVRLLQPGSNLQPQDQASLREGYRRVIAMSEEACDTPGALVIWPESAAWPFAYGAGPMQVDLERLTRSGCRVLLNSPVEEGGRLFNSAFLIGPAGAVARYDKRRLVPWGEYVPLQQLVPFVGKLARHAGSFSPGGTLELLPVGREQIGISICYEVIFPRAAIDQVEAGATILATITNDAWYGDSWGPYQHFRAARMRAAETRRPMVRAALSGISGLIDPSGRVSAQLGVGEQGILSGRILGGQARSPFSKAPWWPPIVAVTIALFAIVAGRRRRRDATQ